MPPRTTALPAYEHRLLNLGQTLLLIGGMVLLLGYSAELLFGEGAFAWTALMVGLALLLAPKISPAMVMRLYNARPLSPREAPAVLRLVAELARRAGLPRAPEVYYIPSQVMNAFAVGDREHAAIAVTDGLLHRLELRELAGVLAHELSHVRHNDMRVMGLADTVSRITSSLSLVGQILIFINLPLLMMGQATISWLGLLLLVMAPTVSTLLQLALSRTREYDADLGAVELTGDPEGLAAALAKIERQQGGWLERIFAPGRGDPDPSLLRTHPPTEERIRRLLALERTAQPLAGLQEGTRVLATGEPPVRHPPRRRWSGVWY